MISKDITIVNNVGLCARPLSLFIQKANNYKSKLIVERGDKRANAKSMLSVLSLGITQGVRITIVADGVDEADAIEGLSNLILTGFID